MAEVTLSACGEIVRRWDRERFLCLMFADPAVREDLFRLYAFNHEVAKTREVTSEHALGLIRLEWWRESVQSAFTDQPRAHEVVTPLAETIAKHGLTQDDLMALIDARAQDLDAEMSFSADELAAYCDATSGQLAAIAAKILSVDDQETLAAVKLVGRAWGVMGIVRATGFLAAEGLTYLPNDGLDPKAYRALQDHPGLRDTCRDLVGKIGEWQKTARQSPGRDKRKAMPVLLQSRLIDSQVRALEKADFNPFNPHNAAPSPLRILSLYWGAKTGRF